MAFNIVLAAFTVSAGIADVLLADGSDVVGVDVFKLITLAGWWFIH
jgi:hypothetical protein